MRNIYVGAESSVGMQSSLVWMGTCVADGFLAVLNCESFTRYGEVEVLCHVFGRKQAVCSAAANGLVDVAHKQNRRIKANHSLVEVVMDCKRWSLITTVLFGFCCSSWLEI